MGRKGSFPDRFWSGVTVGDPDDCWEWQRSCKENGYGQLCGEDGRTPIGAHVASWRLHFGDTCGLYVCHKCDNPRCCNPSHLFLGTARDNAQDAIAKGRRTPWNRGVESDSCSRGHEYTGARDSRGNLKCILCRREGQRTRRLALTGGNQ